MQSELAPLVFLITVNLNWISLERKRKSLVNICQTMGQYDMLETKRSAAKCYFLALT